MVHYEPKFARINATSDGDNTVISGVANHYIVVTGYVVNVNAAGVITIQDSAGTPAPVGSFEFTDGGGASASGSQSEPLFKLPIGLGLEISNAAGVDCTGHITYYLKRSRG